MIAYSYATSGQCLAAVAVVDVACVSPDRPPSRAPAYAEASAHALVEGGTGVLAIVVLDHTDVR